MPSEISRATSLVLTHALALAAQGLPVFPCRGRGEKPKAPVCPDGFHDASRDAEQVHRLWHSHPGLLIGVPTGEASGLAVLDIDIDIEKGKRGDLWLWEHFDRLPATRVHGTQSGGFHLLFQHQAGLGCNTGGIARGVDVRAEGGYVIWWPAAGYDVLVDAPPAPWPEWVRVPVEHRAAPEGSAPASARGGGGRGPWPVRVMDEHVRHRLLREVVYAPVGQRNDTTFRVACRFGEQVRMGVLDAQGAIDRVVCAAQRNGLPADEAYRTVRSGLRHVGVAL